MLELMEHVVSKEGFRTEKAKDGAEALSKAEALMPDLVLLDLMLPGKGGYEVLRDLQAGGNGRIPVVMVTGRNFDVKQVQMLRLESNFRELLTKPIKTAVLIGLLHNILQTRPADLRRAPSGDSPLSSGA
jgi:CheY-like chemotaxis protein